MVRATKLGKKRPFIRGFLLTIVSFGIYRYYWLYKAHIELYKQFELEDEGREDGVVWLILGLLIPVILYVYIYFFTKNLNELSRRLNLRNRITPLKFILVEILAFIPIVAGFAVMVLGGTLAEEAGASGAGAASVLAGLAVIAGGLVMLVLPYYWTQEDVNDIWDAYDTRMDTLTRSPPEDGPGPGTPQKPPPTRQPDPTPTPPKTLSTPPPSRP